VASTDPAAPASVLDASALMALIHGENGQGVVAAALAGRSAISIVNWAEVLLKVAAEGEDPVALEIDLRERGFIGLALSIEGMTEADCVEVARLRPPHRTPGPLACGSRLPGARSAVGRTGLDDGSSLGRCRR
jgi:PIN domain nuclease of toxin-antitoxin system